MVRSEGKCLASDLTHRVDLLVLVRFVLYHWWLLAGILILIFVKN
jgi:hypothetical protein